MGNKKDKFFTHFFTELNNKFTNDKEYFIKF